MAAINRISDISAAARAVHAAALRQPEPGDVRDGAEKAQCAARRAVDALILARPGVVRNIRALI